MGLPLAGSLLAVGHVVTGYDLRSAQLARLQSAGGRAADDPVFAVSGADFVFTCLPDAAAVRSVWVDNPNMVSAVRKSAVLVDCSTIGVDEVRAIGTCLETHGLSLLDAPVVGDPRDARARLVTFVVGGSTAAFAEAKPVLEDMGEKVIHVGKSGMGQAAALCNQLMTVINLMGVAEAFALAERLGLPVEKLFEVAALSSASSWALAERCPQSGLVPEAPSNNLYQAGVPALQILRQMRLLEQAAGKVDARAPLTAQAVDLYGEFCDVRDPRLDFSAVIQLLRRR
jgi:3-hydroxyisobutyrate dehydrogenase